MHLAHVRAGTESGMAVVDGDRAWFLPATVPTLARDPVAFLDGGSAAMDAARAAARRPAGSRPLAELVLRAPLPRPRKFLGVARNYPDHAAETGAEPPAFPVFFTKQPTCVIGPGDAIEIPAVSDLVDYEGELGVVIGRRCRHVAVADALAVVAGYTVVNDVTVRDWQRKAPTMMIGKSFDTHGPLGPWITTADAIPDPQALRLRTLVNGEVRQDDTTAHMQFGIGELVATLTTAMTLEPGDVIATGTPAGVGIARRPPAMLRPGDTVRVEVEGIGALENPVVDARARGGSERNPRA